MSTREEEAQQEANRRPVDDGRTDDGAPVLQSLRRQLAPVRRRRLVPIPKTPNRSKIQNPVHNMHTHHHAKAMMAKPPPPPEIY